MAEAEGLALDDVTLYMNGQPLEGAMILANCASDLTTLDMEVRMLGGKYFMQFVDHISVREQVT